MCKAEESSRQRGSPESLIVQSMTLLQGSLKCFMQVISPFQTIWTSSSQRSYLSLTLGIPNGRYTNKAGVPNIQNQPQPMPNMIPNPPDWLISRIAVPLDVDGSTLLSQVGETAIFRRK
jgi:hypothetical protein